MPKASAVAAYLRNLADKLSETPDAEIVRPMVSFHHWEGGDRDKFLVIARLFTKPLAKEFRSGWFTLSDDSEVCTLYARISASAISKTVKEPVPAEYEYDPDFMDMLNS